MRLLLIALLFAISYAQTGLDTAGSCPCKPLTESLVYDDMTDEVKLLMDEGYGSSCNQWDLESWTPYDECKGENSPDYCNEQNWCVLGWCYVDGSCASATPSDAIQGVPTQIYYSYETCGTPNCFIDSRRVGCPFDPDGVYGCPTTIQIDAATSHPVETGCPSGTGTADLQMDFETAEVVHRNLNGKYCDPSEWNAANGRSVDGSVDADEANLITVNVNGQDITIPSDCVYDDGTLIPEEILYCDVGTDREGNDLCLRIVDVQGTYECENTFKCGNVKENNSILGQIQINQNSANPRVELEYTVMSCTEADGSDCVPVEWDNMFMTFLDIDGQNYAQEEIMMHDIWDYYIAQDYTPPLDLQWKTTSPFHAIYPGDVTVDNRLSAPEGIMFPNMNIEISDPDNVYRWFDSQGNVVDNRLIGTVTVRNRDDLNGNGNIQNPTDLSNLDYNQASRSVTAQWVSDKWLNQQYNGIADGDQRTSFRVTMGTRKRTILFAGQADSIVSLCDTCQQGFAEGGNTCSSNQELLTNRICSISGYSALQDLDSCTRDWCCADVNQECRALDARRDRNEQGFHTTWTDSECQEYCGNANDCGRGCGSRCQGCPCNTCAPIDNRRSSKWCNKKCNSHDGNGKCSRFCQKSCSADCSCNQ